MKMRNPMFAIIGIWLVLLSACGREVSQSSPMTSTEAMNTIANTPQSDTQEFLALIQDLADSGQLQSGGQRGAISSTDLSTLTSLLSMLQGGSVSSITQLVNGLVNANNGSSTQTSSSLTNILSILNMALPIITAIAPQFAPIIQAVVSLVPIVIQVIQLFKKPKTSSLLSAPIFA